MELSVAAAQKRVGESFPFELSESVGPQSYGGRSIVFEAPLRVSGTYVFDGKAFLLDAKADTALASVCARCAKPFVEPYAFPIHERFVKATELSPDEDEYPYVGDKLEITAAVFDNLFLQLPLVSVCRPDCKGLCPVCGADRNSVACNCQPNEPEGPFAALAARIEKE